MQREGEILCEKDTIWSEELNTVRVDTYLEHLEPTVHYYIESAWIRRVDETSARNIRRSRIGQFWLLSFTIDGQGYHYINNGLGSLFESSRSPWCRR